MAIEPVRSFARINCVSGTYADAVEKGYSDYLKYSEEIKSFGDVEYDERLAELKHLLCLSGIQTIVFSAMCFEAAIFDYASIHLGDDYVHDNLDKLDTLSKWVVVLRFVSGVILKKEEAPYGLLKSVIQTRNKLVHAKSEELEFEVNARNKQLEKAEKKATELENNVHTAFRALATMSLYLDQVQEDHHNPLPSYSEINASMRNYYQDLKPVIAQCRQTVAKIEKI